MIKHLLVLVLLLVLMGTGYASKKKLPETVSLVHNLTTQRDLYDENVNRAISIASMTKLVTVLTVLEAGQNLSEQLTVVRSRDVSTRIRADMRIARSDLISLAMVSSDNLAARTLMEYYPGGYSQGIWAMNQLVGRLGAENTTLVEPTGIMAANTSTARDMVLIAQAAASNPLFSILANQNQTHVSIERTSRARQIVEWIVGRSTNPFLEHPVSFRMLVAKTGFTRAAGFCLVMIVEYNQQRYALVTAGHTTKQARKKKADELIREITRQSYQVNIRDDEEKN